MKKIFLMCISIILLSPVMAQDDKKEKKKNKREERKQRINAIVKQEEEGVIKYRKHLAFGLKLTTDGYGGFVEVARAQSVKKALLFQLDIAERKHPKEEKIQGLYNAATPFIYGKINFFYPVKLGVQQQFLLGNKGNKNGVSITANAGGGLIVGLLRPYKVEVIKNGEQAFAGYESEDSLLFLQGPIGGPNFGTGWNELKVTPGGYLKSSVRFDYGKYNEMVSALEVGISGEFYSKKIPQMIYQTPKQFFFSAYIALIFGKRK
ncbi:MAG TPA: hypothetical protein PLC48_07135 [Ferruginibacter sp.]|nr:hypothetical protein [Ferruginibacter sp.]